MRLPKSFIPDKNLDKGIEALLKHDGFKSSRVNALLEGCDSFLEFVKSDGIHVHYGSAKKIVNTINYNQEEMEQTIKEIFLMSPKQPFGKESGYYISAMINKICKDGDILTLDATFPLSGLGAYLNHDMEIIIKGNVLHNTAFYMAKGKIIVKGDADGHTGNGVKGGELIIEGDTGYCSGGWMHGGKLIIKGDSGGSTGWLMEDGEIHVEGDIDSISMVSRVGNPMNGKIYNKGELVYPLEYSK